MLSGYNALPRMTRVTESNPVSLDELRVLARARFGDMIKGVVDLRRAILLLDADLVRR